MSDTTAPARPAVIRIDAPNGMETCDRCEQNALWRVVCEAGELLFCGHHARRYGFAGEDSHSAYQPAAAKAQPAGYKGQHRKKDG